MVGFSIVLGLALLLSGPVSLILVLIQRREVRALRRSLEAARRAPTGEREAATRPMIPGAAIPGAGAAGTTVGELDLSRPVPGSPAPARAAPAPGRARDLETVIGAQWLTWFGVLALFLGTAFFIALDLGENALAGTGQVLVGVVVGALFIVAGRFLAARAQSVLGRGLLGCGVTLLFLAAYGSAAFHELVPVPVVYVVLLGVAAIGSALALGQRSLAVASITLLGALLTPPLLRAEIDPTRVLFVYLLALAVGSTVVATRGQWPGLVLLGFFGTLGIVLDWWHRVYGIDRMAVAFAGITPLWLVYTFHSVVLPPARGASRRHSAWQVAGSFATAASALAYAWFLFAFLARFYEDLRGPAIVLLGFVHVAAARLAVRMGRPLLTASTLHYTGLALGIIAVPVHFDAAWTTLAWTLLGFVLVVAGLRHRSVAHRWIGLLVYAMAAFRVLAFDTTFLFRMVHVVTPVANASFVVGVLVAGVLGVTARLYHQHRVVLDRLERPLVTALALAAPAVLLVRVSAESIAAFHGREIAANAPGSLRLASLLTLSFIWAAFAALLIAVGFAGKYRPLRILGFVILAALLFKVFLVDTQSLDRGYRIASFLGVGGLLLVISIFYQRGRRRA